MAVMQRASQVDVMQRIGYMGPLPGLGVGVRVGGSIEQAVGYPGSNCPGRQ